MRVLPPCPRCRDLLYGSYAQDAENDNLVARLRCYECGWKSGLVTARTSAELNAAIAETTKEAKAK